MKILSVELNNLNSLSGTNRIDFTEPPFESGGIFAIVGPTGSGKSTILDALCLALYGQTPRLGKVAGVNEIMSKNAGFCSSEVVFETYRNGKPERFRCKWSQRRARQNPDGSLQAACHELSEADTGKILEERPKFVPAAVEERTGMDFDRFTRSMMLAQGNFARFLESDNKKRAEILEQITGTEIYSRISMTVHERNKEEKQKLAAIEEKLAGVVLLESDAEAAVNAELKSLEASVADCRPRLSLLEKARQRLEKIAEFRETNARLENDWQFFLESERLFQPEVKHLAAARRAKDVEPAYQTHRTLRMQCETNRNDFLSAKDRLPKHEENLDKARKAETESMETLAAVKRRQGDEAPVIRQARQLDGEIRFFDEKIVQIKHRISVAANDVVKYGKSLDSLRSDLSKLFPGESFEEVGQKLRLQEKETETLLAGRSFEDIVSMQTSRNGQLVLWNRLLTSLNSLAEFHAAEVKWTEQRQKAETETTTIRLKLETEHRKREETEETVRRLRSRLTGLRRILDFEEARKHLEDGRECPLCGALEHPFATGNVPAPDEAEQELEAAEQNRDAVKKEIGDLEAARLRQEDLAGQADEELKATARQRNVLETNMAADLAELGLSEIPSGGEVADRIGETEAAIAGAAADIKAIDGSKSETNRLNKLLARGRELAGKIETESVLLENAKNDLESREAELVEQSARRQEKVDLRAACFGENRPDDVEKRTADEVTRAEHHLKRSQENRLQAETAFTEARQKILSAEQTLQASRARLAEALDVYRTKLRETEFDGESDFLEARLDTERFTGLDEKEKKLTLRRQELETLRRRNAEELNSLLDLKDDRPEFDLPLEELDARHAETERRLDELLQRTGRLREKIRSNDEAKKNYEKILEQKESYSESCRLWYEMDRLLGSSDGTAYRVYAQGLTFRIMVEHANRHLRKMSDRYILVQSDSLKKPLDLDIMDTYQADVIRSTKNLSGGESFMVSLALALGLSSMSSDRVRVDSLFLDEGFGTLDEQMLDTALAMLEGLREEGKQIGIISHVKAIRERIAVQVQLVRIKKGQSRIEIVLGPL